QLAERDDSPARGRPVPESINLAAGRTQLGALIDSLAGRSRVSESVNRAAGRNQLCALIDSLAGRSRVSESINRAAGRSQLGALIDSLAGRSRVSESINRAAGRSQLCALTDSLGGRRRVSESINRAAGRCPPTAQAGLPRFDAMRFEVLATDGAGRRGRLTTAHGVVETPAFMPVGTRGTVKALGPDDLIAAGAQIVLANTYHLLLKPGHELIRDLGGLHVFMGWDGPILTDSGGFQVFSLSKIRTLSEDGVEFRSPIDGSTHVLTPERSIEIQHALGADIIHPLDECLAYPATREATERSLALTLRWARRSQAAHTASASAAALFGIVQGG